MSTAAQFRNLGLAGDGLGTSARLTTIITITTTRKRGGSG